MPYRHRQRLKRTLRPMVVIVAPDAIHMQRRAARLRKALQAMRNHLTAQVTNLLSLQAQLNDAVWSVRKIDDSARQRLVKWRIGVSKARKTRRPLQSVLKCGTQRKEGIFTCVVVVNVQVALAAYPQTPASVFCECVDHVVEEADAGVDGDFLAVGFLRRMVFVNLLAFTVEVFLVESVPEVGLLVGVESAAVEVYGDLDFGLVGVAVEAGSAGHRGGRVPSSNRVLIVMVLDLRSMKVRGRSNCCECVVK